VQQVNFPFEVDPQIPSKQLRRERLEVRGVDEEPNKKQKFRVKKRTSWTKKKTTEKKRYIARKNLI